MLTLIFPSIDPNIVQLGPISIRWYGLAYIAGLLLGWQYIKTIIKNKNIFIEKQNLNIQTIKDFLSWAIMGIIVGGRLGYVIFYGFSYYSKNILEILFIWKGGMSFHGGLLGIIFVTYLYIRKKQINFFSFTDLLACAVPIGIFFGRIANFINAELIGRVSNLPWAVIFPNENQPRHPSQIYESLLEGLLLFLIIRYFSHYKKKLNSTGLITGIFLTLYGFLRIIGEFFREPDSHLGYIFENLTLGMILSIPMIIIGIFILYTKLIKNEEYR